MTSNISRIYWVLAIGLVAVALAGCRHPNYIHLVRTPMGLLAIAPQPGDIIIWEQIDVNSGASETLAANFTTALGTPCDSGSPPWMCKVTEQSKGNFYLYTCNGCQDPGVMPGSGTKSAALHPGPSGNSANGKDHWDPVVVSCVKGSDTYTDAFPSPSGNIQWVSNTVKFTVIIGTGICTQGPLTITEKDSYRKTCTIVPNPPPSPTYSLHVDNCGPDQTPPIKIDQSQEVIRNR